MTAKPLLAAVLAAGVLCAAPAVAAPPADGSDLVFELGAGALVQPTWEGSSDVVFSAWPIIGFEFVSIGPFTLGGGPERAFSLSPSFGFRGERDDNDHAALTGIGDVDAAVEAGARASYRYRMIRASVALRRGFGGHEGFVGEAALEIVVEPTERWTFAIGPQVSFADDEYMDTYFGVTAAQAAASGLAPFSAGAGFKSVGVIAETRYRLTEDLSLRGKASYHRLIGDAADSPIVAQAGSEDQFMAGVGLSYRFRLDLFD